MITLVFDFDGTIADTMEIVLRIINNVAVNYGYQKVTPEQVEEFRNKGAKELFKTLRIPLFKLPFLVKRIQRELQKEMKDVKPIEGIQDALIELKRNRYKLGILSSNSQECVQTFLTHHDMNLFDFIYSGSSIFGKDKVIAHMLADKKIDKSQVIYVGDEVRDIEAAKKSGVRIIAVAWGYNSPEALRRYQPDYLIDKPLEILTCLSQ